MQFLQIRTKMADDHFHIKVLTLTKTCSDLVGAWWNIWHWAEEPKVVLLNEYLKCLAFTLLFFFLLGWRNVTLSLKYYWLAIEFCSWWLVVLYICNEEITFWNILYRAIWIWINGILAHCDLLLLPDISTETARVAHFGGIFRRNIWFT